MDTLLIGLSALKVATSNFSIAYKLGEGGFGPVYKVLAVQLLSMHSVQFDDIIYAPPGKTA